MNKKCLKILILAEEGSANNDSLENSSFFLANENKANNNIEENHFTNTHRKMFEPLEDYKTFESFQNVSNTDYWKVELDENKNSIEDDTKDDTQSTNEILSVTLHETITEIPTNSKEYTSFSNIEEYNSSIEELIQENKYNNTIDTENVEHVIIKKVLNVQDNINLMAASTSSANLISPNEIISSCLQLERLLTNYTSTNYNTSNPKFIAAKLGNQKKTIQESKLVNESLLRESKNHDLSSVYSKAIERINTEQDLNIQDEATKQYKTQILSNDTLSKSSAVYNTQVLVENVISKGVVTSKHIENTLIEEENALSASAKNSSTKQEREDAAATLIEGYSPQNVEQTFNDHLADELSDIRTTLAVPFIDRYNRSTVIIIFCAGTAFLFILILVTIFLITFQRQNGTLNIEMHERNCGKDNLDEEDAQTFAMLLEIELSQSATVALDETDECL